MQQATVKPKITFSAVIYRACDQCSRSKADHEAGLTDHPWTGKTEDVGVIASYLMGNIKQCLSEQQQ